MDWRSLALWLADCHAATAEYDGTLASTSMSRKRRLAKIARTAHRAIETGTLDQNVRDEAAIVSRLKRAEALAPTPPDAGSGGEHG